MNFIVTIKKKPICCFSIFLISLLMISCSEKPISTINFNDNIDILTALEQQNISELETIINEVKEDLSVENDNSPIETQEPVDENINFKDYYKNSVFMGDSLVEPLSLYGFLDASSVVAKVGENINKALSSVDTVSNLNPDNIIILYGLNDMGNYSTGKEFAAAYEKLLQKLLDKLPDSKLYIISVLPVQDKVWKKNNIFSPEKRDEYNENLTLMCENLDITYIDLGVFITQDDYEPDGMHLVANFYPTWLKEVKNQIEISKTK